MRKIISGICLIVFVFVICVSVFAWSSSSGIAGNGASANIPATASVRNSGYPVRPAGTGKKLKIMSVPSMEPAYAIVNVSDGRYSEFFNNSLTFAVNAKTEKTSESDILLQDYYSSQVYFAPKEQLFTAYYFSMEEDAKVDLVILRTDKINDDFFVQGNRYVRKVSFGPVSYSETVPFEEGYIYSKVELPDKSTLPVCVRVGDVQEYARVPKLLIEGIKEYLEGKVYKLDNGFYASDKYMITEVSYTDSLNGNQLTSSVYLSQLHKDYGGKDGIALFEEIQVTDSAGSQWWVEKQNLQPLSSVAPSFNIFDEAQEALEYNLNKEGNEG